MPWAPVVDGVALTDTPLALWQAGKGNQVPYLGGSNNNEGFIFMPITEDVVPGVTLPLDKNSFVLVLDHFFCNDAEMVDAIMAAYPVPEAYPTYDDAAGIDLLNCFFLSFG